MTFCDFNTIGEGIQEVIFNNFQSQHILISALHWDRDSGTTRRHL